VKALHLKVTPPQGPPFDHEVVGSSLVVGRSRTADLSIADQFLSRVHARFLLEGADWFLESLGSHNPTLQNGRPVVARVRVAPGDVLSLGGTRIAIEAEPSDGGPGEVALTQMFRPASEMMDADATASRHDAGPEATLARVTSRLKLVNEVHRAFSRSPSQDALLELILDHAFDHLRPEEGAIFLGPPGADLKRAASRRLEGAAREFLYSRSLARQVTEKGLAALVEDALGDARFATSESIVLSGARSIVAAPLLDGEGCLGMIVLASRSHVHRFAEEDLELLVSLASAAALRIRNFGLAEKTARHQLLEKELALAHDIQMGMLPKEFPSRAEFELAAAMRPAHSVGGDLYEFLAADERLWFIVGDVSGKGVAAALLMAVTKTLFRAFVQTEGSLSAVVARMNRELCRENERSMFVTAFAGCLHVGTGALEVSNAGHSIPYRIGVDGLPGRVTAGAGMALGVVEDFVYATGALQLDHGESLFLYTDGVTEARDPGGGEFSEARLEECLRRLAGATATELVEGILGEVQAFAGTGPPHDDVTALAIRYL
jgi:serine phosphatase RsbU (regulator of sigma subunit)